MKKIWYLSTCSTCTRIMKELSINSSNFELYNIKDNPISKEDLELIQKNSQYSYEELFNKRAMKYAKTGLKHQLISDTDFKNAILKEYTFLKRPIIQINNNFFIGNSKKTIQKAQEELDKNK